MVGRREGRREGGRVRGREKVGLKGGEKEWALGGYSVLIIRELSFYLFGNFQIGNFQVPNLLRIY